MSSMISNDSYYANTGKGPIVVVLMNIGSPRAPTYTAGFYLTKELYESLGGFGISHYTALFYQLEAKLFLNAIRAFGWVLNRHFSSTQEGNKFFYSVILMPNIYLEYWKSKL